MRLEDVYLTILGQNCIQTILNWVISWQMRGGGIVVMGEVYGNYMKIVKI